MHLFIILFLMFGGGFALAYLKYSSRIYDLETKVLTLEKHQREMKNNIEYIIDKTGITNPPPDPSVIIRYPFGTVIE